MKRFTRVLSMALAGIMIATSCNLELFAAELTATDNLNSSVDSETVAADEPAEAGTKTAAGTLVASGTCGDPSVNSGANVTWKLVTNDDSQTETRYTLTISGNGAVADYTSDTVDDRPWSGYLSGISEILVESGVTRIGDYALYSWKGAEICHDLVLPDTVKTVGIYSFWHMSAQSTRKLSLPGVTSVDREAFRYTGFGSVSMPAVQTISSSAFGDMPNVSSFEIGSSLTEIGAYAFYNDDKIAAYILPPSVSYISYNAFGSDSAASDTADAVSGHLPTLKGSTGSAVYHYAQADGVDDVSYSVNSSGGKLKHSFVSTDVERTVTFLNTDGKTAAKVTLKTLSDRPTTTDYGNAQSALNIPQYYAFDYWSKLENGQKTGTKYDTSAYVTESITLYPVLKNTELANALDGTYTLLAVEDYEPTAPNCYTTTVSVTENNTTSLVALYVSKPDSEYPVTLKEFLTSAGVEATDPSQMLQIGYWNASYETFTPLENASDYFTITGCDDDLNFHIKTAATLPAFSVGENSNSASLCMMLHVTANGTEYDLMQILFDHFSLSEITTLDAPLLTMDMFEEGSQETVLKEIRKDLWFNGSTRFYADADLMAYLKAMDAAYEKNQGEDWAFKYIEDFYEEREGAEGWSGDYMFYQSSLDVSYCMDRQRVIYRGQVLSYVDLTLHPMNDTEQSSEILRQRQWVEDYVTALVGDGGDLDISKYDEYDEGAIRDAKKAQDAYQWVRNHITYESGYNSGYNYGNSYSFYYFAYAGFYEGKGSCECMAQCFYYICRKLGVNNRILFNSGGHVYNMVQVGDAWYYTDCSAGWSLKGTNSVGTFSPHPYIMPTSSYDYKVFKKNYLDKVPKADYSYKVVSSFTIDFPEGATFAITNKSASLQSENKYTINSNAGKVEFTVTVDSGYRPRILLTKSESSSEVNYTKLTSAKNGRMVFTYSIAVEDLASKTIACSLLDDSTRSVTVSYDSDLAEISAVIGNEQIEESDAIAQASSADGLAKIIYEVPAGATVRLTITAKDNCQAKFAAYAGNASKGTFKTTTVSLTPIEPVTVTTSAQANYDPQLYQGSWTDFSGAEDSQMTGIRLKYTLKPEDTYTFRIRKGPSDTDTKAKVLVKNGSADVTSKVLATTAAGVYQLQNLNDYAGKTLKLTCYANGSNKVTATLQLAILNNGAGVKKVTVAGTKNNALTQTVGTVKTYKVTLSPTAVNMERIYLQADGSDRIDVTDQICECGLITVETDIDAAETSDSVTAADLKKTVRIFYRKGDSENPLPEGSSDTAAYDNLLATVTISPEKTSYAGITPTASVSGLTDKTMRLSLALPKGYEADRQDYLYYSISAQAILDKNATGPADRMVSEVSEYFLPVTESTTELTMVQNAAAEEGNAQKYSVQVSLVLSSVDHDSFGEGQTISTGNILARSKVKSLTATTMQPAYPAKLKLTRGTQTFYAGMAIADEEQDVRGVKVATLTYDNKATHCSLESIAVTGGPDADKFTVSLDEETGAVYVALKPEITVGGAIEPNDITPGRYTITAVASRADSSKPQVKTTTNFTIKNPIRQMTLTTTSNSLVKAGNQSLTIRPSLTLTGTSGSPASKKVTYTYTTTDENMVGYVKLNSSNGQLTINGRYTLPEGQQPVITLKATAADYEGNQSVCAVKEITLKATAAKPTAISIVDAETGESILTEGQSLAYQSDALENAVILLEDADGNPLDNRDFNFRCSAKAISISNNAADRSGAGKVSFVSGQSIKNTIKVTITATATDGSRNSIRLNIYVTP